MIIKNSKLKVIIFALIIVILNFALFILNSNEVRAQTISLAIWPPLLEVQLMPGKTVSQVYRLTNNTESFLNITPQLFPFEPLGEKGQIRINQGKRLENDPSPYFFSFATGEEIDKPFIIDPQATKEITLSITLPKGTPEKDYYFTLLFSTTVKEKGNSTNKTSSVTQIGTNILLTSSVDENPALLARIILFSAPKIIDSFSPAPFVLKIENWGKTFFKTFGKIEIKGSLKQEGEIKLLEQNVLAGSIRNLDLPYFKPKFPFGPFKATLELYLNETKTDTPLSKEIVFWYLPYKIILLLFLLVLLYAILRKFKK